MIIIPPVRLAAAPEPEKTGFPVVGLVAAGTLVGLLVWMGYRDELETRARKPARGIQSREDFTRWLDE